MSHAKCQEQQASAGRSGQEHQPRHPEDASCVPQNKACDLPVSRSHQENLEWTPEVPTCHQGPGHQG